MDAVLWIILVLLLLAGPVVAYNWGYSEGQDAREPREELPDNFCPANGGTCNTCVTTCVDYGRPGSIGMG